MSRSAPESGTGLASAAPSATTGALAPAPAQTQARRLATAPARSGTPAAQGAAAAPRTRSTPQQLRLLSSGVVALGLLVGLVGALTFALLAYTLQRAEDDTAQLIRVQKIQTNLLSADAAATNAFLVGGLEPAAQRSGYDRAMSETGALIAQAARAQPADATALAVLNSAVLDYTASIEQARANNRQGLPVGAQYLRLASGQLRSQALPVLDELVGANARRADAGMGVGWGFVFPVLSLLALGALVLAQVWLARRFHRRINAGMLAASAVLLAVLVASLLAMGSLTGRVAEIRDGSFAVVNTAAGARIEAYDAKANESLTLIARGSGQSFEQAWTASAAAVTDQLGRLGDRSLRTTWDGYTEVHQAIRKLDNGGSWDKAVAQATGTGDDSANTRFTAFDSALATVLEDANTSSSTALAKQTPGLVAAAILALLAGLAAALLARRGVAARLREYR